MVAVLEKVTVADELQRLASLNEGILKPEDVVMWASDNPDSALYGEFDWDDSHAAREHRIWQARQVIKRIVVMVGPAGHQEAISAFVSLQGDRAIPGGGYRITIDVLGDAEKRKLLLTQALSELRSWQRKYRDLKELAEVFAAADVVKV